MIRHFTKEPHKPLSITESSNQLYVGTYGGIIFVYQNEIIINQFNGSDGDENYLTLIIFDQHGYMATSDASYPTSSLNLYSHNCPFTGKSITTHSIPRFIGFDSKGRFIQISDNQISIYN